MRNAIKYLPAHLYDWFPQLSKCPNFSASGSIAGMRKVYGPHALLVRCGAYIYNVAAYPDIYVNYAHRKGEKPTDIPVLETHFFEIETRCITKENPPNMLMNGRDLPHFVPKAVCMTAALPGFKTLTYRTDNEIITVSRLHWN